MEPIFKQYKNSEVDDACKWTLTLVKRKGIVLFTKKKLWFGIFDVLFRFIYIWRFQIQT